MIDWLKNLDEEKFEYWPIATPTWRTPWYLRMLGMPHWRFKDIETGKWTYETPPFRKQKFKVTDKGLYPVDD